MRSYICQACFCAILVLVSSPGAFATIYEVYDGNDGFVGDGGGDGWGTSCSAWANADGDYPYAYACAWGSKRVYTDAGGYFTCTSSITALAYANYADFDSGGGTSSDAGSGAQAAICGTVTAQASVFSGGPLEDYDNPPSWYGHYYGYLAPFDGFSSLCGCGADASVTEDGPNLAYSSSAANANVSLRQGQ